MLRVSTVSAILQRQHHFCYEQVLGTTLEMVVKASTKNAEKARDIVLAEIDRLEAVYSCYNPQSELNQFLSAPLGQPLKVSADLYDLLEQSLIWMKKTYCAFHPAVEVYLELWKQAAITQEVPVQLENYQKVLQHDIYRLENGYVFRLLDVPLNFNAVAKGLIVDRALEAASSWASEIAISIGGDLRHKGQRPIRVALEDKPVDNFSGGTVLSIKNRAVATSGLSRRGFDIAGRHYSHIIDPRTGQPVQHTLSVTVIAADCMTADVLATAFNVLGIEASLCLADHLEVACMLTEARGTYKNALFKQYVMKG